jgi:hypothetical protein
MSRKTIVGLTCQTLIKDRKDLTSLKWQISKRKKMSKTTYPMETDKIMTKHMKIKIQNKK